MAKINNAVRIIEFKSEREFYYRIQDDLTSYMDDPDSRCIVRSNGTLVSLQRSKTLSWNGLVKNSKTVTGL